MTLPKQNSEKYFPFFWDDVNLSSNNSFNTDLNNFTKNKKYSGEVDQKGNKEDLSYEGEKSFKGVCTSDEYEFVRTVDSWDLPKGSTPWEEKNSAFEQLLRYSDLALTEEEEEGLLTDRIIASCISYITRSPASKCYIAAKLCLDNKNLSDIRIIQYHKFLQYVNLSRNNIKDLSPLGHLPYLMYLDVSYNLLEEVLRFKPPWNLTYVNYSHNDVWHLDDLSEFWSLSFLDLSHNKISKIWGLDTLRYLRHLNLSHNKITKFENLNNTRITDLNLDHNNISAFETGKNVGIKTMLQLRSLSLNYNMITNVEFLKDVYHLKTLELQGNRISNLMDLSDMKCLRMLRLLDLTGNPACQYKPYRNLLLNTLPGLKYLDMTEVDITEKVATCLSVHHKLQIEAAKNNARMILMDQLNDTALELDVLPIDQSSFPLVILVGPSASGKKILVSKLGEKYPDKIFIGKLLTTSEILEMDKSVLIKIKRTDFNEKIKKGHFFCVMENLGHLYGFSKEMLGLAIKSHKLCLTYMDLEGALTIHSYGIQPFLVLTILKSEEIHEERLRNNYGPIVIYPGAFCVGKRLLSDTYLSKLRRVREIINDLIEEIINGLDEKFCSRSGSQTYNKKDANTGTACGNKSDAQNTDLCKHSQSSVARNSFWDESTSKKFECFADCSPNVCGLQEIYKTTERKQVITTNQSVASTVATKLLETEEEVNEEGNGSCSTSYSALASPPYRVESHSFDDECSFNGEDDIFADWSSPFIDWNERNIDLLSMEKTAEQLCEEFINRVLATRSVYQSIHLDNPGLFSYMLFTDEINEAEKKLMEFLKEVWCTTPMRHQLFNVVDDYAYRSIVPKRLEKLKKLIRDEKHSAEQIPYPDGVYSRIDSPRTIVTQMHLMGYEHIAELF